MIESFDELNKAEDSDAVDHEALSAVEDFDKEVDNTQFGGPELLEELKRQGLK